MVDNIVQFSAPVYFAEESEESLTIDIIRLGTLAGVSKVRWSTLEASAKAGKKYHDASGTVTFKDGEHLQSIAIDIVQDETWSPTLEFKVELSNPEGCICVSDCEVCRIKIIDDDLFPSNKYRDKLEQGAAGIEQINPWGLFAQYCMLNLGHEGILWRSIVSICFDQMNNFYLFFLLKARTYLVNEVFNTHHPETRDDLFLLWPTDGELDDRVEAAMLVGAMYVLPMLVLHMWDYAKIMMDVEGHSRVFLQTCIFRKYLNYTEASRQKVRVSHMQVAIMNNTADLAKAYVAVLEMLQMLGKLALLMVFMLTQDRDSAWVLVVMPGLMLIFGCARSRALSQSSEFAGPLKKVLIDLTTETCAKYRTIADYSQRPQMNELFERRATELRRSVIPELQVELNNNYFPKLMGPLFIGLYITFISRLVLTGEVSLGVFLATLSVFNEVSSDFSSLYKHVMSVNTKLDSLKTLTRYFNMETDLRVLKSMNEHRRRSTQAAWAEILRQPKPPPETGLLRSDLIAIKLDNMTFGYSPRSRPVVRNATLSVPQGRMVAIVGSPGSGKGTFLRLMSQTIFPTEGDVLIPLHLRLLFVAQLPVLFDRSPWHNLVFGRPDFADVDMMQHLLDKLEMRQTSKLLKDELQRRAQVDCSPRKPRTRASSDVFIKQLDSRSLATLGRRNGDYIELHEVDGYYSGDDGSGSDRDEEEPSERTRLVQACCSAARGTEDKIELEDDSSWQDTLSFTEQVKMCLLRALIANPEVLVLHRPFHNYDNVTQEHVLELLKEHTENRGLGLPTETWAHRRPRTVFFTPESIHQAKAADIIWQIEETTGHVQHVSSEELQRDFRTTKHREYTQSLRSAWASPAAEKHLQAADLSPLGGRTSYPTA